MMNFDRFGDVDLELGRRVRDALVAENLPVFCPAPTPFALGAAQICSGITVAGRAAAARRVAEIRIAWSTKERTP